MVGLQLIKKKVIKLEKSDSYIVSANALKNKKNKFKIINCNKGDVILFNTMLIHKSIPNYSSFCRFTVQYRFALNNALNFLK